MTRILDTVLNQLSLLPLPPQAISERSCLGVWGLFGQGVTRLGRQSGSARLECGDRVVSQHKTPCVL